MGQTFLLPECGILAGSRCHRTLRPLKTAAIPAIAPPRRTDRSPLHNRRARAKKATYGWMYYAITGSILYAAENQNPSSWARRELY